jgi:multicomponent Na+:H+ antiporter subunit A
MGILVLPTTRRDLALAETTFFCALPLLALAGLVALLLSTELPLQGAAAWVPGLGVQWAWRIDGLSALMLLMITGVGSAVFCYAGGYLAGHPQQRRLYVLLLVFTLAMIGCVVADDLVLLFVFWELTSLTSFMLVGFNHADPRSRQSAQQALLVTGTGGLALLAGMLVLAQAMGTSSISEIVARLPATEPTPALTAALVLILVGCFTKSAQFPFHFWLPNAMSAPTPVSAFLHSATMVKLGVFLLARLDPGFGHWPLWSGALVGVGSLTAAWGMLLALRERDLKRILAWSTVATLGTLVMLIGLEGDSAAVAVGALLLAHALYKAPLFFVAGNIDHGAGTRIIDRLGGLRHAMPWTAAAALLAGLSMAGLPASFGFVVKDVMAQAKSAGGAEALVLFARAANTVFGAVAVAVAGVAAIRVFWRHPGVNDSAAAHECGPSLLVPPLALAGLGIALGLFPFLAESLVAAAGGAMTPDASRLLVSLTPALAPTLASLGFTLLVGGAIFWWWDALHEGFDRMASALDRFSARTLYERSLAALPRMAARATRALQHGRLPGYATVLLGSCTAALLAALAPGWATGLGPWPAPDRSSTGVAGACALIVAGAIGCLLTHDRLKMLLAAGLVGYGSALLFLFTGAPDLAFTQFAVETVFVIVVACVLLALKRQGRALSLAEPRWRPGHAVLALVFAGVVTSLLLLVMAQPLDLGVSHWFAERSLPEAQGRNVVNVILVDFRAIDTFGEIAVVLLSLLAALPLLQALRRPAAGTAREVRP